MGILEFNGWCACVDRHTYGHKGGLVLKASHSGRPVALSKNTRKLGVSVTGYLSGHLMNGGRLLNTSARSLAFMLVLTARKCILS